jgi:hypothetical protein
MNQENLDRRRNAPADLHSLPSRLALSFDRANKPARVFSFASGVFIRQTGAANS